MSLKENLTGIILAGGKSSRMGVNKGFALLDGKPLIAYSIDTLSAIAGNIIISGNTPGLSGFGLSVVNDLQEGIGPMGGIYSSLLASGTDVNVVLSCDMPFIDPGMFLYLMEEGRNAQVILPTFDGIHPEPMCGIYKKELLPILKKFIDGANYKLPDVFRTVRFKMIPVSPGNAFYSEGMTFNINTPDDLEKAGTYIKKRS